VRFTVRPKRVSQGEAIATSAAIATELLPPDGGYAVRVAGESESFVDSGNALAFAYGLALLIVYLVLAAQFESFVHPITILVAVALSFTGALLAIYGWGCIEGGILNVFSDQSGCGKDVTLNIYSKIGLVMLVGLVTKNSILIVEFANQLRRYGRDVVPAAVEAARTRFRPILMTALATMVGILPVALGRGSGGDARAPLGIAVVGGMFFSTILTFFVVPATYIMIERLRARVGSTPIRAPVSLPTAPR
jgi:multidrug efflux pump